MKLANRSLKTIVILTLTSLLILAQSSIPVFTATSGTTCNVTLDTVNKVVNVACGITPNPVSTVLSFNPHVLENGQATNPNVVYFNWSGVAMTFTKPTPASNLSYQFGVSNVNNQFIVTPTNGSIAVGF